MKKYIHYFKNWFIVLAFVTVVFSAVMVGKSLKSVPRTNEECLTEQRVFDYGDKLTDTEEAKLTKFIAKVEKKVAIDIVLVVLNESLEEFAESKGADVAPNKYVQVYAEDFLCKNHFGYDVPTIGEWDEQVQDGNTVILVDNWYRESDGKMHTWFAAFGTIYDEYGYYETERILDAVYKYIETDPYSAYRAYIKQIEMDNRGTFSFDSTLFMLGALGISFIIALVFMLANMKPRVGKKTVNERTYIPENKIVMHDQRDDYIRSHHTTRIIETSSSSGGGGSRRSGGGRSSGGGRGRSGGGRSR